MAYCTQDDILEQLDQTTLIQLTDDAGNNGIDSSVVARAIADADAEIDGYCGARYSVPFSVVPAIIRKFSVAIAIKNLFSRRRGAPDPRRKDYEDAIAFLKDISKGTASLGQNDPDGSPAASNAPDIDGPDRVFSRDNLEGF
jgi:phage gp36-like protein